jgi:hypothetical protein
MDNIMWMAMLSQMLSQITTSRHVAGRGAAADAGQHPQNCTKS